MGQGLFQLCAEMGKLPHELRECSDDEFEYLKAAHNYKIERENKAMKDAGR